MIFVVLTAIFVLTSHCLARDLPSYFPRCSVDDPDLNNCILKAANTLRPHVRKGIKEINLSSFDPFILPMFSIVQDSQLANYTCKAQNFTIRKMHAYDITEIRYDPKTLTLSGRMEFDPISVNTVYDMQGSIVSIPIIGKGTAEAVLGPINGTFEFKGNLTYRKGVEYYNPTQCKVELLIEDGSYLLNGLFNGNEELARLTNEMLNANSKAVTHAVTPALATLTEENFMRFMKSFTKAIPYYKIFPRSR